MEVLLLDIQNTAQENQYLTTVLVDDSVHHFTMKVNDTPAPMLTILGDEQFYEVLGRNYSFYRPLFEKVGSYHLNGNHSCPSDPQTRPSPRPKVSPVPLGLH